MEPLDQVIAASWHDSETAAEQFFAGLSRALATTAPDGSVDLTELRAALADEQLPDDAADAFVEAVGRLDAADVLTQARAGPEYLTARYLQLAEAAAGTDEDEQAVAEASAENAGDWDAYLAQCGSEWDGTEDSWPAFREWFAYHGETAGVATFAQAFLVYAEESGDKAAVFAEYGIAVPAAAAEDQEGAPEDVFAAGDLEALFAEDDTAEAPGDAALSAAVADAIEEAPELARMSDEDIAALIEGALADIAQQG